MSELAFDLAHQNDEVYGSFHLGYAEFAIPATSIKDVINAPERFAPQPLSPDYVLGIMTLRDMTMPVIDLQLMFDLGGEVKFVGQICVGAGMLRFRSNFGRVIRLGGKGFDLGRRLGFGVLSIFLRMAACGHHGKHSFRTFRP